MTKKPKFQWLCELCYPNATELGEVVPGYWLAIVEGKYVIVGGQGHNGDIEFEFPEKPLSEVVPPRSKGQSDKDWCAKYEALPQKVINADIAQLRRAKRIMGRWKRDPSEAYSFIKNHVMKSEYNSRRDGYLCTWLYFKCGRLATKAP